MNDLVLLYKDFKTSKTFEYLEKTFIIGSLILYSGGIFALLISGGASEGDGRGSSVDYSMLSLLFIANYLGTVCLYAINWPMLQKRFFEIIASNYVYWVFLMFIPLSKFWSVKPDETMSGAIGMAGTVMFGVYIASRYTAKQQFNLLVLFCGVVSVLSLLTAILFPYYGIMAAKHAGAVRGIFTHKNMFSPIMVLSTSVFLLKLKMNDFDKRFILGGLGLSFLLLLVSRSSSGLLNSIILMSFITVLEVFRLRSKYFLLGIFSIATLIFFIYAWSGTIAEFVLVDLLGKDMTFTGRTDIWPFMIDMIRERPWLGYGFNGFWHGIHGKSFYVIHAMRWDVPSAHNGYIDLIISLGIVGASLLFLYIWTALMKSIAVFRAKFSWYHAWPVAFTLYLVLINLSESCLVQQNTLWTLLMTMVYVTSSREFSELFDVI